MTTQDVDLSEPASPHKLEQARKRGSVAKSTDLTTMIMLAAMLGALYASGASGLRQLAKLQQAVLAHASHLDWRADSVAIWIGQILLGMLHILAPLFLTLMIAAVLANLLQTGPVFSLTPLSPAWERLNPAAGFKRLFSMRTLYDTIKSMLKLGLCSAIIYSATADAIPGLLTLSVQDPKGYGQTLASVTGNVLIKLVGSLFIIGLLDLGYTRWEFAKRMRMSRRDMRDESKQRDGDPRIRARVRALRKEMLKRSNALRNLPKADVLIMNPTHIAVALRYQHAQENAPQLIAKGAGDLAQKMRQIAGRHRIPIVQNKMLARVLFREVAHEGYVPEKCYAQVAKIMVWVYTLRQAQQESKKETTC